MRRQAEGLGLRHFEFVDAVDASSIDRQELIRQGLDDEGSRRHHGRTLTLNEVACSLSHRLVYERIVAEGHSHALVVEDDALFLSRRVAAIRTMRLTRPTVDRLE